MSFAEIRVQPQQLFGDLAELLRFFPLGHASDVPAVDFKQGDIGGHELRVDFDGLTHRIDGFRHALISQTAEVKSSLFIKAPSLWILGFTAMKRLHKLQRGDQHGDEQCRKAEFLDDGKTMLGHAPLLD